jgi:hypothetical protein
MDILIFLFCLTWRASELCRRSDDTFDWAVPIPVSLPHHFLLHLSSFFSGHSGLGITSVMALSAADLQVSTVCYELRKLN